MDLKVELENGVVVFVEWTPRYQSYVVSLMKQDDLDLWALYQYPRSEWDAHVRELMTPSEALALGLDYLEYVNARAA